MKKLFWILVLLLVVSVAVNVIILTRQPQVEVKTDTTEGVRFDTITDALPVEKSEKIVQYIRIPCSNFQPDSLTSDSLIQDSMPNSLITLPVVQKVYSDDSTYTAYVSGAKIDSFPRLDSINVRQKTTERTVTITITEKEKPRRLRFGFYAGYGYGFLYKGFEPQIGGGITYTF